MTMSSTHLMKKFLRASAIRIAELKEDRTSLRPDLAEVRYSFSVLSHPVRFFRRVKDEGKGSARFAALLWVFLFLLSVSGYFLRGYAINYSRPEDFNIFLQFASSGGLILAFCLVNWALCTLLDGKGSLREIWLAVCTGFLPRAVFGIPLLLISNVVGLEEQALFTMADSFVTLWCCLLVFIGLMIVHEYSFGKTLFSCLLTALGIAAAVFLAMLLASMIGQLAAFIKTVGQEAMSRG